MKNIKDIHVYAAIVIGFFALLFTLVFTPLFKVVLAGISIILLVVLFVLFALGAVAAWNFSDNE